MVGFRTGYRRRWLTVKPDTVALADNLLRQIFSELRQLPCLDSEARGVPDIIFRSISLLPLPACLSTAPATGYLGCCGGHFPVRLTVDQRVYLGTYIIEISVHSTQQFCRLWRSSRTMGRAASSRQLMSHHRLVDVNDMVEDLESLSIGPGLSTPFQNVSLYVDTSTSAQQYSLLVQ